MDPIMLLETASSPVPQGPSSSSPPRNGFRSQPVRATKGAASPSQSSHEDNGHGNTNDDDVPHIDGICPRFGATGWMSASKEILHIFGGCDATGTVSSEIQRINIVSLTIQHLHFVKGPGARFLHATAVHPLIAGKAFTFGGCGTAVLQDDLWEWDQERWQEIRYVGDGPGKRHSHQITITQCGRWMVLVGGSRVTPSMSFAHDELTAATSTSGEAPMFLLDLHSKVWRQIATPPTLDGRRLFSITRLPHAVHHDQLLTAFSFTSPSDGSLDVGRSGIGRKSIAAVASSATIPPSEPSVATDTFVITPGVRSTDTVLFLSISGGDVIELIEAKEKPLACELCREMENAHEPTADSSFAEQGGASLKKHRSIANITRDAAAIVELSTHVRPTRRAGRICFAGIPFRTSHHEQQPSLRLQRQRSLGSNASPPTDSGRHKQQLTTSNSNNNSKMFERSCNNASMLSTDSTRERSDSRASQSLGGSGGCSYQSLIELVELGGKFDVFVKCAPPVHRNSASDKEDHQPSSLVSTPYPALVRRSVMAPSLFNATECTGAPAGTVPERALPQGITSFDDSIPLHVAVPIRTQPDTIHPLSLLSYLSLLECATVVDLPTSVFIFGGRNAIDQRVSGAVMIVNKPAFGDLVDTLATGGDDALQMISGAAATAAQPNSNSRSASTIARRSSARFQAIVATMGAVKKRQSSVARIAKGPTAYTQQSVLEEARKVLCEAESSRRLAIASDVVDTLRESESADTRDEAPRPSSYQLIDDVLAQMDATSRSVAEKHAVHLDRGKSPHSWQRMRSPSSASADGRDVASEVEAGSVGWDVHEHYESVVDALKSVGLGSPVVADEAVTTAETAFYLRQTIVQQAKKKRTVSNGQEEQKYDEWFHPPLVTRAEKEAVQRLAEGQYHPRKGGAAKGSVGSPRGTSEKKQVVAPVPLCVGHTVRERQFIVQLRKEEMAQQEEQELKSRSVLSSATARGGSGSSRPLPASPPPPSPLSANGSIVRPQRYIPVSPAGNNRFISAEARMAVIPPHRRK